MLQCIQCDYMDLSDQNKFGDAFCTDRHRYYDPYSSACSGFKSSSISLRNREDEYDKEQSSGCYLTTAMCGALGYDDNCCYLNILRNFRDTYMMNNKECLPMLVEYEVIGPIISRNIANDKETANIMLENYIAKAIMFIKRKDYQSAITIYQEMFYYLKDKYNLNNLTVDMSNVHFDEKKLDKTRIRTLAKDAKLIRE